jgi:hypothetical protein
MNIDKILISRKSAYVVLLTVCVALLLPLVAMQFTSEVNWAVSDFIVAGVLLSFSGYLYQVLTSTSNNTVKNITIGLVVVGLLGVVWINLI